MCGRDTTQELRSRLAGEITVVEPCRVVRKNNFRSKLICEVGTGSIFTGPHGPEELIGDARLGDMEDHGIAWLSVVKNEAGSRARCIPLAIKIMPVHIHDSLRAEKQYSC